MGRTPRDPNAWMLRACFWLLAVVILVMVGEAALATAACMVMVLTGQQKVGACIEAGVAQQVREVTELALTTVLALLLAARPPGGGPPQGPPPEAEA